MITLPITCKTIIQSILLTIFGLCGYGLYYGLANTVMIVAAVSAWILFSVGLITAIWYGYSITDFIGNHVKCKCDKS